MTYLGQRLRPINDYTGRSCRAVLPDVRGAESSLGSTNPNFRKGLARRSQRDYSNKDRQLNCLGRSSRYTDSPLFWKPANSTHCYSGTRLSCEFEPPVLLAHFDSLLTCPDIDAVFRFFHVLWVCFERPKQLTGVTNGFLKFRHRFQSSSM